MTIYFVSFVLERFQSLFLILVSIKLVTFVAIYPKRFVPIYCSFSIVGGLNGIAHLVLCKINAFYLEEIKLSTGAFY